MDAVGERKTSEAPLSDSPSGEHTSEKKDWRKRMARLRRSLSTDDHRGLSQLICRRLDGLLGALNASSVAVYAAVKGEAELSWLWESSQSARPRTFYFPRVSGNDLVFHATSDPDRDLSPGEFGIPAPPAEARVAPPGTLDVVVTPGLAFDPFGARIGSGAGYYDRWFGAGETQPIRVGVGFEFQMVWDRPLSLEPFDVRMDWIVTNREAVRCLPYTYQ